MAGKGIDYFLLHSFSNTEHKGNHHKRASELLTMICKQDWPPVISEKTRKEAVKS